MIGHNLLEFDRPFLEKAASAPASIHRTFRRVSTACISQPLST
ncbi:hypothetical protein BZL30_8638 [Mycobacterium kansasii]|uniref:Uncharacterized protein n=1 Tax=Mycobacterium kansasii TaxID=1768 RepID=A0A1V3WF92_MYCKA|nr:hypothetical protein BZL30_8638 [Mycobacterium kansasii]